MDVVIIAYDPFMMAVLEDIERCPTIKGVPLSLLSPLSKEEAETEWVDYYQLPQLVGTLSHTACL